MKPIHLYLDEAITKGAAKNDSDIARKIGVGRMQISRWRSGEQAPDDEQAVALARLIGKPEIELMAEAAAHRAKSPEIRSYWERIAKYSATYASMAAIVLISSLILDLCHPLPGQQAQASNSQYPTFYYVYLQCYCCESS